MSDVATMLAQLSGRAEPAADPAMAAVRLARASIDALVLKLGQTIAATIVAELPGGFTQLSAGTDSFVLKLASPLPTGTEVKLTISPAPSGQPQVIVTPQRARAAPVAGPPRTGPEPTIQVPQVPPSVAIGTSSPVRADAVASAAPRSVLAALPPAPAVPAAPMPASTEAKATMPPSAPVTVAVDPPGLPAAVPGRAAPVTPLPGTPVPDTGPRAVVTGPPPVTTNASSLPTPTVLPTVPETVPGTASPAPAAGAAPTPPVVATSPPPAPVPVGPSAQQPAAPPVAGVAMPPAAEPPAAEPVHAQVVQPTRIPVSRTSAVPIQLPASPVLPRTATYPVVAPRPAQPVLPQPISTAGSPPPSRPAAAVTPLPLAHVLADPAQAAARQDSLAPLLAKAAAIVAPAALAAMPRPLLEAAARLLATRLDLTRAPLDGKVLKDAVLKAGVITEPGSRPAGDARLALLALRAAASAMLGGEIEPVAPVAARPPPPLKGEQPRAPEPSAPLPLLPAEPEETARELLRHSDGALSRLKLLQNASGSGEARSGSAPAPAGTEIRVEVPLLLGAETGILQLLVERDGKRRAPPRERGWRMSFALNFSATGEVGADIALLGGAANIGLWAARPETAEALETMLPELGPALARHGLEVKGLRVRRGVPRRHSGTTGQILDSAR